MIQIVRPVGAKSLTEYVKNRDSIEVERPTRCTNKRCERSNCFWKHTGYKRTAREGDLAVVISIERFLCKYCGLVVSCLFDFLIPYVIFSARAAGEVVQRYASSEVSYRGLSEETAAVDVSEGDNGPRPSHVQIFRWVRRMASQSSVLLVHVQRFAVQVKQELLSESAIVCPNRWKSFTKEKMLALDDLLKLLVQSSLCCGTSEVTPVEWLHRYFLQTSSMCRAVLSGRKLRLSAQQRA
jgi:hypothetical protein